MPPGVLFAFGAYALYSCCDAIIKGLGSGLSVYEIAFFTTLFSLLPAMLATPKGESWLTFWKLKHPVLLNLRGISGTIGNLCIIYAFVTIPLAEAYSLAFLAPIFIVLISIQFLGEKVSLHRGLLLAGEFRRRADRGAAGLPRAASGASGGDRCGDVRRGDDHGAAAHRAGGDAHQPDRGGLDLYPRPQRHDDDRHPLGALADTATELALLLTIGALGGTAT